MKKTFIILLTCCLSACGYHLRGMGEASVKFRSVYVEGASGFLREQFDELLKASSANLAPDPKGADLRVKVVNENFQRRTMSLGLSGRSNEFELSYHLEFQLAGPDSSFLPADRPLEITRAYFNDQQDILAKNNEEDLIRKEMYQQAVRSIVDRARTKLRAGAK